MLQFATAKAGVMLVNINPAYRTHRARVRAQPVGLPGARGRQLVQDLRLRGDGRGGARPTCATLERTIVPRHHRLGRAAGRRRAGHRTTSCAPRAESLQFDDPINIQYTSGTTGFPKGATLSHHNILNNGFFIGELCRYTEADRVCIPVPFYHCFGMVLGNLACTTHGACMVLPDAGVRAALGARGGGGGALHEPLRRADDVHRRARPSATSTRSTLSSLRTGIMAGSPCPVEVMRKVIERMHMDEVTICYGMTETSPVSTQTARRRPARAARRRPSGACTRTWRSRSSTRSTAAWCRAASAGELLHPRLLRDARLLERPGAHRRGDRRAPAGCTPATSPRWTTRAT